MLVLSHLTSFLNAIEWPLAVGVSALIILVAAPFWNVPLSRDQGVYATCADVLLRGGVPFRDCWDTKGPAMHVTYAVARLIFGHRTYGPYALNAIAIAATSLVVAGLAYRLIGHRRWAYITGLLYGLLAIIVRFDMNAQPESFANFFALLGMLLIVLASRSARWWMYPIGGAALALAVAYKYALILPYGAAALALIALLPHEPPYRPRWAILTLTAAGAVGVGLLFAIYLLIIGALDEGLTHLEFIFLYFPRAQLNPDEYAFRSRPVEQTLLYIARLPAIWGAAFAGIGLAIHKRRWYGWWLASALFAGIAVVWGQQRFTPYHWTASLPVLALSMGALAHEIRLRLEASRFLHSVGWVTIGAAVVGNIAAFFYADQWMILGAYLTGRQEAEAFFESQGVWDHMVAADYIRARTDPHDKIWVWGHHTSIYYLAERESPTRFIYNEPLLMHIRGGNPWQAEWRAEALDAIYADPPVYLLLTTFDRTFFDFQNPNDSWRDIPEYNNFTRTHYIKEWEFGRFQFFRLKPYWSRQNDPALLDIITDYDLIGRLNEAKRESESDPPIQIMDFSMPGEPAYPAILMHPDAALEYTVHLEEAPVCLRVDIGMLPDSWGWGGDGATFRVEITTGSRSSEVFRATVSNAPEDQHWHPYLIDLREYSGHTVTITFMTTPGPSGDYTGDWAGWGLPRIVHPPAGDYCDTNQIVDERAISTP